MTITSHALPLWIAGVQGDEVREVAAEVSKGRQMWSAEECTSYTLGRGREKGGGGGESVL
jgi:hypothetical protein